MSVQPRKLLKGETGDWEVVVGLEVHAQVISKAKLFSGASAAYGAGPNENVSMVDAAMPGMLPVINRFCVEQAVRTGLGLNAKINLWSRFDRKNYFYPDLPQGYQISQYKDPIVGEGEIEVELDGGETIVVGIERLHLEQDAGKSIHDLSPKESYVDLNRAGVALMEIVSRPDMRSADEAAAYFSKLRTILRYLGTCDGNMEEGSMRADVNVSVRRPGEPFGTRTETKNINSIRYVKQAVEYEARRQIAVLESGGEIEQETRLFNVATGETRPMRSKEDAHDYRYFPDPDLLPLELDPEWVERIRNSLPELPDAKKHRFIRDYGLSAYDAAVLAADRARADYFEAVAKGRDGKLAANWVTTELFGALNRAGREIEATPVAAERLGALIDLIAEGVISGRIAKDVFAVMFETGEDPAKIVEERGLKQVTDAGAIEKVVDEIIAANPAQVEQVKAKPKTFGWFVGQVMKATAGKANPQAVNDILKRKLGLE
ncbi:Asp-tRNA(Asn)/Glu-tRNA(Gln) amidotransferase subunit GatB [Amphiplicatus metriothermophilus]|uniref:Aspartyl/glutamyl-tRNA(Asn/Gln) amidotransferase subunit B n=1 Tax=Amphiplicatus metriothermophilus TaxID=1519374 RepID=A0A239PTZ5_9PROT|nr:Asp-tRNA(Asn)/Glu-tRNA(Gln) amidotransferase subunit GatB [Amphiplicatus metriothermophilus]MBB5519431.1 aspartyl-tRNA(Asn)/glutamyl-tRNA(Gln) amidotransferase subunit B [Amphiplicatus metriothermophilus]SNT73608.1 aspartyl/glutamyl-tRNA(Asn/Gln) amidotransferase subunit B [Amphiplicatus metriothermophilus]